MDSESDAGVKEPPNGGFEIAAAAEPQNPAQAEVHEASTAFQKAYVKRL